jgi:hypothetical protein
MPRQQHEPSGVKDNGGPVLRLLQGGERTASRAPGAQRPGPAAGMRTATTSEPPRRPTPAMNRSVANSTRVTKTLWPPQPGTRAHSQQYSNSLVCVRYRRDTAGLRRYTTVEIIVSVAPVANTRARDWYYPILIERHEKQLAALIKAHDSRWDPTLRLWYLRGSDVQRLHLEERVWTRAKRPARPSPNRP